MDNVKEYQVKDIEIYKTKYKTGYTAKLLYKDKVVADIEDLPNGALIRFEWIDTERKPQNNDDYSDLVEHVSKITEEYIGIKQFYDFIESTGIIRYRIKGDKKGTSRVLEDKCTNDNVIKLKAIYGDTLEGIINLDVAAKLREYIL